VVIDQTQGGLGNLGSELVTIDFTSATSPPTYNSSGWAALNLTINSPTVVTKTSTTAGPVFSGLTVGRWYRLSVNVASTQVEALEIRNGETGASPLLSSYTASLSHIVSIAFLATNVQVYFRFGTSSGSVLTFNSISIKQIPGNHATASSDAKRPLFARYPATGRRNLLTYSEDISNAVWAKNNLTPTTTTSMAVASGVNFSTLFSGVYTPGVSIRLVSPLFTVTNVPPVSVTTPAATATVPVV